MQTSVQLYSADPGILVADLANAYSVSWQDPFNEAGTGEFSLPFDDPQGVQIVPGTQVRCYLDGLHVFTWVVQEPPRITAVDESEESGQEFQVSGNGKADLLKNGRVYPYKGTAPQVIAQHRVYSFASPDFPNTGSWVPAVELAPQSTIDPLRQANVEYTTISSISDIDNVVETVIVAAPIGWEVTDTGRNTSTMPDAFWIWGQADTLPVGFNYFRGSFTLVTETKVAIAATADNWWTLYLDGVPLLGDQGEAAGWLEHKRVDVQLPAGTYYLAAVVENIPLETLPPEFNPAGFLCAVYTFDGDDHLLTTIVISDDTWNALPYPAVVPGWTPGQIVLDAIDEVQSRGGLVGFVCDFDGVNDSGGNPWVGSSGAGSYVPGYSTPVGSTVLDIIEDLVSLGWVDWRFDAATNLLKMWSKGTGATMTGIDLIVNGDVDTQNVVSIEYAPHHPVTTAMFVKWSNGFLEVSNAAAAALYGRVEGFLTVDTDKVEEATRQANVALDEVDNVDYAIVAHIDPIQPGVDEPYLNFVPGDFVDINNQWGVLTSTKVFSISVASDDMGVAAIVLELNNRLRSQDQDVFDITQALGRGVVGSTKVRNAAATTSPSGSSS